MVFCFYSKSLLIDPRICCTAIYFLFCVNMSEKYLQFKMEKEECLFLAIIQLNIKFNFKTRWSVITEPLWAKLWLNTSNFSLLFLLQGHRETHLTSNIIVLQYSYCWHIQLWRQFVDQRNRFMCHMDQEQTLLALNRYTSSCQGQLGND